MNYITTIGKEGIDPISPYQDEQLVPVFCSDISLISKEHDIFSVRRDLDLPLLYTILSDDSKKTTHQTSYIHLHKK